MVKSKFERMYPNPANINAQLKGQLKTKITRVEVSSNEVVIETEESLTTSDKQALEEFLKVGLNSIWKFKGEK